MIRTLKFKLNGSSGIMPTTKLITVNVLPDIAVEGDETLTVTLSNPTVATRSGETGPAPSSTTTATPPFKRSRSVARRPVKATPRPRATRPATRCRSGSGGGGHGADGRDRRRYRYGRRRLQGCPSRRR